MKYRVFYPTCLGGENSTDYATEGEARESARQRVEQIERNPQFFTIHAWRRVRVEPVAD